jgi:thiol-disulfide isomerase/thioredoxin
MKPRTTLSDSFGTWIIRALELLLLVLFCLAGACWLNAQAAPTARPVNAKTLTGKAAPGIVVSTLDGKQVSLADYKGKALIVNFWATWCGNCKLEMPWLAQLREKYAAQGFEVLGIVTDNAPIEKIEALARESGVKYPVLVCNHATAQAYGGLPDLPESFFIDRPGRIVAEMDGADSKEQIEANIRKALRR